MIKERQFSRNCLGSRILLVLITLFLVSGCQLYNRYNERRITRGNQRILLAAIRSNFFESAVSDALAATIGSNQNKNSLTLVYVIDGGCSVCIAEFLSFVKCFSSMKDIHILGIVHKDNIALLQYYCSLLSVKDKDKYVIIAAKDELYTILSNEKKNVFLVSASHLYKSFSYVDGRLIEHGS